MDWVAVLNVVASAFSLVLAIVAMILSIVFYRFSDSAQRAVENSTREMSETVDKLELLYSRLYTDLLSMTNETVRDMRRSVFGPADPPPLGSLEVAADRVAEAKSEVLGTIRESGGEMLEDSNMDVILQNAVERALEKGRILEREVRSGDVRSRIVKSIRDLTVSNGAALADEVMFNCSDLHSGEEVREALVSLRSENLISWNTTTLMPGSILTVLEVVEPAGNS